MYSLLGRYVLDRCDEYGSCCCTVNVVLTKMCQDHLDLDISAFAQSEGGPNRDVSGSFSLDVSGSLII